MQFVVNNLTKTFVSNSSEFQALKDLSFSIPQNSTVAITGRSGSGKSTLLNILAMLDSPSSGEVIFNGLDIFKLKPKQKNTLRVNTFGFVFQQFFLNDALTVLENVELPLMIAKVPKKKRKTIALDALKKVGLEDFANNLPTKLSGGQKQRVCVARAVVNNPKIIFADEPTGNLDSQNAQVVEELMFSICKEFGSTLLLVTHDQELAKRCEYKLELNDGQLVYNNDYANQEQMSQFS